MVFDINVQEKQKKRKTKKKTLPILYIKCYFTEVFKNISKLSKILSVSFDLEKKWYQCENIDNRI